MQETFANYHKIIEEALAALDIPVDQARNAEEGQWTIYSEQAEIYLDLWPSGEEHQWNYYFEENNVPIFQVIAPICEMPQENREAFMAELLEMNRNLFHATFLANVEQNMVCLGFRRVATDMQVQDVLQILESIGYYAGNFGPMLANKYQVRMLERQD